jgi:hypothetical protein
VEKGLKTGIYYLRRRRNTRPQQFTIEPELNGAHNNDTHNNLRAEEICVLWQNFISYKKYLHDTKSQLSISAIYIYDDD